jgi:hypothetical protein
MTTVIDDLKPSKTVEVIRGQYHKFKLIPMMEHHARWFSAGPIAIAVETRALGLSRDRMVRGPSIHVFSADHAKEYMRFDMFGRNQHYHYILDDLQHNIVWGYDADANGPMLEWIIASLQQRLPSMLRRAGDKQLADQVERHGWDTSVLAAVEQAARDAERETDDELDRAAGAWSGCILGRSCTHNSMPSSNSAPYRSDAQASGCRLYTGRCINRKV